MDQGDQPADPVAQRADDRVRRLGSGRSDASARRALSSRSRIVPVLTGQLGQSEVSRFASGGRLRAQWLRVRRRFDSERSMNSGALSSCCRSGNQLANVLDPPHRRATVTNRLGIAPRSDAFPPCRFGDGVQRRNPRPGAARSLAALTIPRSFLGRNRILADDLPEPKKARTGELVHDGPPFSVLRRCHPMAANWGNQTAPADAARFPADTVRSPGGDRLSKTDARQLCIGPYPAGDCTWLDRLEQSLFNHPVGKIAARLLRA